MQQAVVLVTVDKLKLIVLKVKCPGFARTFGNGI
jgi:hypothetical protein